MAKIKAKIKIKVKIRPKVKAKSKARPKARPKVRPKAIARLRKTAKAKAIKVIKMPKAELKKYKELLMKERLQVGGDLTHIAENTLNKSARDSSGDLSGYAYHMADQATDDYDRDFALGRATDEQKILFAIDEALKRVEEGTYGNCLGCGCQIAKKRLAALPHSEYCIECQKKKESK